MTDLAPHPPPDTRPDRWCNRLTSALPALSAALVLLLCAPGGIGLPPDAEGYVRLARDILARGFAFWNEPGNTLQPPLYPLVLAGAAGLLRTDPLAVAAGINAACLAGIIALLNRFTRAAGLPPVPRLGAGLSVLACAPSFATCLGLQSEPLFTLALTAAMLAAISPRGGAVALAALAAGAAAATRHAGVVLLPPLALLVVWTAWRRTQAPGKALAAGTAFGLAAALPWLAVVWRNRRVGGHLMGERHETVFGPAEVLGHYGSAVLSTVLPKPVRDALGPAGAGLVLLVLAVPAFWALQAARRRPDTRPRLAAAPLLFAVYSAFLVTAASRVAFDAIQSRLIAPALVLLGPWAWVAAGGGRVRRLVLAALLLPASLRCAKEALDTVRGEGIRAPAWRASPGLDWVRRAGIPKDLPVFSNRTDALLLLAGQPARKWPRRRPLPQAREVTPDPLAEHLLPGRERALWIWFTPDTSGFLLPPEEIAGRLGWREVARLPDATVYATGQPFPVPPP